MEGRGVLGHQSDAYTRESAGLMLDMIGEPYFTMSNTAGSKIAPETFFVNDVHASVCATRKAIRADQEMIDKEVLGKAGGEHGSGETEEDREEEEVQARWRLDELERK